MQFWVYMLRCADGSYYVGHTDTPETRIAQHEAGLGCDWTRRRLPVELVWADSTTSREEALAFERRVKGWTRAKKEALIAGDWDRISWLARPPRERPSTSPFANAQDKLRTNEIVDCPNQAVRPERRPKAEVEGHPEQ
jgi:putative endonuclease